MSLTPATYCTLSNGLRVANFSSPHAFAFEDGTVLEAVAPERSRALSLDAKEVEQVGVKGTTDIVLSFKMNAETQDHIDQLNGMSDVDIVLVPFPVMTALKEGGQAIGKCRCIRTADRITKKICIGKFCI